MTYVKVQGFKIYNDRHGRKRCYHRATGMAIDLDKVKFGSEEFFAECSRFTALKKAKGGETPGSLGALVKEYKKSPTYVELARNTKIWYEDVFELLIPINDTPLSRFDRPLIIRIRDKAQEKHSWYVANKVKTVLSTLFSWGVERGYMKENYAKQIRKLKRPKDLARGNRPWKDEERFIVLKETTGSLRYAIALMMYMGMDPIDAVSLPKENFDGERIKYSRQKTGNETWQTAPESLLEILKEIPAHDAPTLIANVYGKPWTKSAMDNQWQPLRNKLVEEGKVGEGLTLKGLRHTKGTMLAEIGEDDRTIADSLAQETTAMARHYSDRADRTKKLSGVTTRFDAAERERKEKYLSNHSEKVSNLVLVTPVSA